VKEVHMATIYDERKNLYPYVVEFEKLLKKGVLNGLTVTDKVHFATEEDAKYWIEAVSKITRDGEFSKFKMRKAV
jgi:hypothetical protein